MQCPHLVVAGFAALVGVLGSGDDARTGGGDGGSGGGSIVGVGAGSTGTGAGSTSSGGPAGAAQTCVDAINQYRSTLGLAAYSRWTDAESCADGQAASDSQSGSAHGAFGACGENAQNECPGWSGPPEQMIGACLDMMWAEGPGADFSAHGHYINMSSTEYTKVACGFTVLGDGSVWAVQDFAP